MATPAPCVVRLGKPDDLAYVVDSWVKYGLRGTRTSLATSHVRALLARDDSRLLVAHVADEPDAILGWAATEDPTATSSACMHYIYVRKDARRLGVATSLVREWAHDVASHSSPAPANVVPPKGWTLDVARATTPTMGKQGVAKAVQPLESRLPVGGHRTRGE